MPVSFINSIFSSNSFIYCSLELLLEDLRSIVISTLPGIIAAALGETVIFPIVETKCWLLSWDNLNANLLTKVIISDAATSASALWSIRIVPLWPAWPFTSTLNLEMLGIDLTMPISNFFCSRTLPCSICNSKQARIFLIVGSGLVSDFEFPPILSISSFKIFPEELPLDKISWFNAPIIPLEPIQEIPQSFNSSPK